MQKQKEEVSESSLAKGRTGKVHGLGQIVGWMDSYCFMSYALKSIALCKVTVWQVLLLSTSLLFYRVSQDFFSVSCLSVWLLRAATVERRMVECLLTRGVCIVPKSNHELILIQIFEWNHWRALIVGYGQFFDLGFDIWIFEVRYFGSDPWNAIDGLIWIRI